MVDPAQGGPNIVPLAEVKEPPPPSDAANSKTEVKDMAALRTESPEAYRLIETGLAIKICNDMKRKQDRLKKISREARSGG